MAKVPVFDIGDTLVPSRRFVEHVIEDELRQRNHDPVHKFDPDKFMMYDPSEIQTYLEKYDLDGDAEEMAEKCRGRYLEAFEDLLIEKDIFDLFARCNKELGTVGVISDNRVKAKQLLKEKLEKHNVEYNTIVVSDEVGVEKPNPEIFQQFIEQRDEPAENFVYMGNDPERDADALKAGMEFIWLRQFDTVNSTFNGPSIEKLTFENLKEAINNLE